jgi:G3E family GTPase
MNNAKTMQIVTAVGPLGAGKTALIVNTIMALVQSKTVTKEYARQHWAYIINDEGTCVDGSLVSDYVKVIPMTNGCFTCSDAAELTAILDRLRQQGIERVFIEGFGITSGDEMKAFLTACPYPFHIVCVLDYKHFDRNLVRYSAVIKSHVHAATIGIGLTKYGENANPLTTDTGITIADFVAENSHGKPIFLIPDGGSVPLEYLSGIAEVKVEKHRRFFDRLFTSKKACGCEHHHGCHDDHHAHAHGHHVHSMLTYSYPLKGGVTFDHIREALNDAPEHIIRIKGAASGKLFNAVFNDWRQTLPDTREFVTFYALKKVDVAADLPELAKLLILDTPSRDLHTQDHQGNEQSYKLMRMESGSNDSTIEEIRALLSEIPDRPIVLPTQQERQIRIITHPESLQVAKEMARRQTVKDEWFPIVLKRCMEYWILCARLIREREADIIPDDRATNKREVGISLAWWARHYGQHFSETMLDEVKTLKTGEMVAEGVLALKSLNSDPERAFWQCQEILCASVWGIEHGEDRQLIHRALEHGFSLAHGLTVEDEWKKALRAIA